MARILRLERETPRVLFDWAEVGSLQTGRKEGAIIVFLFPLACERHPGSGFLSLGLSKNYVRMHLSSVLDKPLLPAQHHGCCGKASTHHG